MVKKPKRLLSRDQLLDRVPVSYPTVLKLIAGGTFPKPRTVEGGSRPFWVEDEVDDWITKLSVREGTS
jgi:predicted DNA-binding transcriptional regulator AlpA